ncbi:MAG: DNA methyltransferase [Beijerinckiaceae bacterium]|nr:DNA methyltransferase [Beijerinckiaceae bacterium]
MRRLRTAQRLGAIPAVSFSAPLLRNTVLQGNCIEVLQSLPARSVDLVLTDPPYLCRYRSRDGQTIANDDNADWLAPAFASIAGVMKADRLCISFYGWHQVDRFMAAWRAAGLRPVAHLVFPKRYSSRTGAFEARHEQAYVLANGALPRFNCALPDVLPWSYTGNRLHPTQKPVEALAPIIAALTRPGDLVLDPFCGSGSTLAAARNLGRDYLGIDLEPRHVQTACARLDC